MLRTQTQKQGSFYVCASCRRQHHQHLAQLRSCSRPRTYHLSVTLRSFAATNPTLATLPTSPRLRNGATAPRHGAPSITTRIDTRRIGGWAKFIFGSPSVPGQTNSAWGPPSKNLPTQGTPSSTSPVPGEDPTTLPAATGTSAWAGRPKLSSPTNPAPSWGEGNSMPPGPGNSAWGGPGSGLKGSGTPAWAPPVKPPPGPTFTRPPGSGIPPVQSTSPAGLRAAPAWPPAVQLPPGPAVTRPPGSYVPPVRPSSFTGLGSETPPRPVTASGGPPHQPAASQTLRSQMNENDAGNGVGPAPPPIFAGAVSRAPMMGESSQGSPNTSRQTLQPQSSTLVPNQFLAIPTRPTTGNALPGEPNKPSAPIPLRAAQPQPGLARNSGSVLATPPPPPAAGPSQFVFGSINNPTSSATRSARPNTATVPGPSGAVSPGAMGPVPTSGRTSNTSFVNTIPGALPSYGVSGGKTLDAPAPGPGNHSFRGPNGVAAGNPTSGAPPGAVAGKPTFASSSGWVPRKPVFGGAQSWAPGKTKPPSAYSTPAKDASGNDTESSSWRQIGEVSHTPPPASASPNTGKAALAGSTLSQVSDHRQAKDPHLERWVMDRISMKPPVRKPPSGAEFPQLPRRNSRRDTFELMSPFKLPSKRQDTPEIKPTAPNPQRAQNPQHAINAQQHRQDGQLPRQDRYPSWTTSSKPQASDHSERSFQTALDSTSSSFPTLAKSQDGASSTADKDPSSQGVSSDDWNGASPRHQFHKQATATADRSSVLPDNRARGRDADREKTDDFRSRDRDYRGRGKDLGQDEDIYAARDKANKRKKFGGDRKHNMIDDEGVDEEVEYREAKAKRQRNKRLQEQRAAEEAAAAAAVQKTIRLPEYITVYDLAEALRIKPAAFLRDLEQLGFEDTLVDSIMTGETAALVAAEYGFEPTVESGVDVDLRPRPPPDDLSAVPPRPPIVTIMGHVDHGKTTILDTLRKSSIVAQEFGGITQHIGAFSVKLSMGKTITFLDTPGHAAFLSMRQRGASVTDIVVLVVAVDDSVKPQTIEAIRHAQSAKVPMIVAINKIDLDDTHHRLDLVKQDLASNGVDVEDFGGDVQAVGISGKTGRGMRELEDAILTLSEVLDMRAETDGMAEGWVLEASIKPDGRAATILVKRGTLRIGDLIVSGNAYTKVRILRNEAGVDVEEAGPGIPIEVYGSWKGEPMAGDMVLQAPDETKAQAAVDYRQEIAQRAIAAAQNADRERQEREQAEREAALKRKNLAEANEDEAEAEADEPVDLGPKVVSFIVKGDVMGSVEAVSMAIQEIGNNEVRSRILRSSPGQITESDVDHMATAKGAIVNFNKPISSHILSRAHASGVVILDHNIIYETVQAVKDLMSAQLAPTYTQRVLAEAIVQQVFPINITKRKYKNIAGAKVINGKVTRGGQYRVMRDGEEIHKGKLSTLKQKQSDTKEVGTGVECGLMFEDFDAFQEGDHIQLYEDVEQKRHL